MSNDVIFNINESYDCVGMNATGNQYIYFVRKKEIDPESEPPEIIMINQEEMIATVKDILAGKIKSKLETKRKILGWTTEEQIFLYEFYRIAHGSSFNAAKILLDKAPTQDVKNYLLSLPEINNVI